MDLPNEVAKDAGPTRLTKFCMLREWMPIKFVLDTFQLSLKVSVEPARVSTCASLRSNSISPTS
jgi:hypothetical protein